MNYILHNRNAYFKVTLVLMSVVHVRQWACWRALFDILEIEVDDALDISEQTEI